MNNTTSWLSLAIWVPIAFGLLLMAASRAQNVGVVKGVALIGAVAGFLVTLPLYFGFDPASADLQFVEKVSWIARFNVHYHLGIDGISLWFVLLTAFTTVLVVLAGWEVIETRVAQYYAAFLILSG
ncbi:MAG: NADH-quinone oxidoreductase subunit M, partial [Burkholderiaceae bacterium]